MDYPYEVPANWKWVRLSDLYLINPKNNADSELDVAFVPMEMISAGMNSQFNFSTQKWGKVKKGHTHFRDGDVAFAKISPCFENRKSMIINNLPNGIGAGTTELIVLRNPKILQTYTYWIVNSENFIQGGRQTYSGTVGQQRISMDYVKDYLVPLAPLPEQHRIVARIEALFSKLDEAKEKAQSVLDSFENRRVAILHKAFTGELTKKWRYERGISFDSWETKNFGEIANVKSNLVDPKGYQNFPHIAPDNIEKKTGRLLEYHTIAEDKVTSGKHRFFAGQILYSKLRPYLSKVVVIDFDGLCSSDMYPIEAIANINTRYLWYLMLSYDFLQQASMAMSGITLPRIGQKELLTIKMHIATNFEEQQEIVRILDRLLSQEQQAKQAAEAVIAQIDVMKKSILARAFRGELGTNDPNDEPARI